ncbi:MAG: MATE family efflux transporter [Candidatus Latescibacterota bacterium]|nr:MAG: MATE family efflux transporter [Candidatus Latescibacterota bacterium]
MKIRATSRTIWAISFPVILAGISEKVVELTDVVFLARYGIVELGAIALADAIYAMAIFVIVGLADGIQIVIARRAGQEQDQEIGNVFNHGLLLLALTSVAVILAIEFLSPLLTAAVVSSVNVAKAVDDFLRIYVFAVIFHAANLAYSAFYVGVSRTRVLIGATVVLAITNIVLDYGLIFGNLGLPRMGIRGAAIASLTAEIAAFLFITIYAWRRFDLRRYGLFKLHKWSKSLSRLLASISSPVAFDSLVETLRWLIFFLIIEQLGETSLAIANIVFACYALLLIPIEGISETTCSMASNLIGQDKRSSIGLLLRKTMSMSLIIVSPFVIFAFIWPEYVISIFSSDPEIIAGSVNSLRVVLLAVLVVIVGDMSVSVVAGAGDTVATFLIEVVVTVCTLVWAVGAAFILELPLEYVWTAEVVGWVVCVLLTLGWLRSGRWKRLQI